MRLLKLGLLFCTLAATKIAAANAVFTITPSATALDLRSDSYRVLNYVVLNTSSAVLSGITINPGYNTNAQLSLDANNCGSLNPGQSCQFNILVSGKQTNHNFTISPSVCAFSGSVCSQPTENNRVQVTISTVRYPVTAYVGLSNNTLIPISLSTNGPGTPKKAFGGFDLNEPAGVCVNPNGTKIYVTNTGTNEVAVINAGHSIIAKRFPVGNVPTALAIAPNGKLLYVVNYNNGQSQGTLSVLDTITGVVKSIINIGNGPWGITINPAGTRLYVSNNYDSNVSIIDTVKLKVIHTVKVGKGPLGIVASPNENYVYVANTQGSSISIINTLTYAVTNLSLGHSKIPKGLAIHPNGTKLYISNWEDGSISVMNTKTNKIIKKIVINAGPLGLAINPQGTQLYATLDQVNAVAVVNLATNSVDYLYVATPQVTMGNFIG